MNEENINFFKKNNYLILKNVISKELIEIVTQYALFDEIQDFTTEKMVFDFSQVENAHSKYADPLMETMLLKLHPIMEENTGLNLYPTYSFYRVYRNGDILKNHLDRDACEISCTLCFGTGHNNLEYCWPIFMGGKEILLNPGDLAIYNGIEIEHWRNELVYKDPTWQVQGFFHYVNKNGLYKDWKYDKRERLGEKLKKETTKKYITFI